jgi:replicative DNA helicase
MKLSAPIYHLKRRAKLMSRQAGMPLHKALDHIATEEGFTGWSLLAAKASQEAPADAFFARLVPGDMVLLGARPGHGKTMMGLKLLIEAMKAGRQGHFFTLEYTDAQVPDRLERLGANLSKFRDQFAFDTSDKISADYIAERLAAAPQGTVAVIDYLQLLDQRRENPELMVQIQRLKAFARERGLILVFISQIDRSYDPTLKTCPDLTDVRLPNPLDLGLFSKTCFLNDGAIQFQAAG